MNTKLKRIVAFTIGLALIQSFASAQKATFTATSQGAVHADRPESLFDKMNRHGVLNTIELAANIGTTGIGVEVASPVTEWSKLRLGFDYMPKFSIPMNFSMENFVDGKINDKFEKIQELMTKISGMSIDKQIIMDSKPTMATFRLLVDVYPFKANKHWHLTAGFFVGGNSFGTSINKMNEMPSLLAINMYDRIYKTVTSENFIENIRDEPIYGDVYLDPELAEMLQEKMLGLGQIGVHVGDFKDGTPYMMMPDKDGTVSAKAKVNRFRPYLGFGYGGALSPDGKWQASFDAGVQFWGGAPKVTTHDGTVLNDLINLRGKVKDYMGLMKCIPIYPTIDFRISYTF